MWLGNGDIETIVNSLTRVAWVLVPLAGIIWLLMHGLAEQRTKRHDREMLHRERVAAFEKGMTEALERSIAAVPPEKPSDPNGLLIAGIITIGAGVGVTLFLTIVLMGHSQRDRAAAVGLVPICVGLSLVIAWFVARRVKKGNGEPPMP